MPQIRPDGDEKKKKISSSNTSSNHLFLPTTPLKMPYYHKCPTSVLKSRDITLLIKVHIVKAMIFLVAIYRYENWTTRKAEGESIDAFELWGWRRVLRLPWTARRSNQLILKEINSEYSLEGLMLKHQYVGHVMQRADSLEKTLLLAKIEGKRRRRHQRMRWLDSITDSMDMNLSKTREIVKNRGACRATVHGITKS